VRNVYEVLREKEEAIERVRREIERLRSATSRMTEEATSGSNNSATPGKCLETMKDTIDQTGDALAPPVPPATEVMDEVLDKLRVRLAEAVENESKLKGSRRISRHLKQMATSLLRSPLG
jgi:sugar-specific transcriptional regulator TrmB